MLLFLRACYLQERVRASTSVLQQQDESEVMITLSQRKGHRSLTLVVGLVAAISLGVFTQSPSAAQSPTPAQSPSASQPNDDSAGEQLAADEKSAAKEAHAAEEESLEIRYARAHLELAKLDLERAKAWNQRIPNVFSERTLDFLRKHVEIDQEQLKQAMRPDYVDIHEIYVRTAKAALDIAEADVARKAATYKKERDNYSGLELDRAMALAQAARLNLERTLNQGGSLQSISYLQWQIEELRNQILELHVKVEAASRR
jgi:hypothetical protein